jgi:serine/threonine-protein kinase
MKSEADLETGTKVGEYVIDGKLGEGGFGSVFSATHPMIGKRAAIKVLSHKYSSDNEVVSRFAAEARAVNQIKHRNIIDIFAFGQLDDGRSYYVMEMLDGQPLDKILDERGGLPVGEAVPILRELARALDAAHAKGIAHRDLKPENVFLAYDDDGVAHPKLLDFGIAKLLGEANQSTMHRTRTGSPIGTPYYMSPEQCRGQQNVDHRTDIYSFGCVAYQLLTGSLPFEGDNHLEIMMKQTLEEPLLPSEKAAANPVLPPLPPAVDDAIAWMMKKDPAERPPSLAEAMTALEQAAGLEPIPRASDPNLRTGPLRLTPTPGRLTPVPKNRTPAHGTTALAQTMAATDEQIAATARASTTGGGDAPAASARAKWPLLAGALVAVVAVVGGIVAMSSSDEKPSSKAAAQPAPPPASAPTPAPSPTATPEQPKQQLVTITVTGVPEHTEVYGPQGPLGFAPGPIKIVRGSDEVPLVLRADGYVDKQTLIVPDGDKPLEVALDKVADKKPEAPKPTTVRKPKPATPKPPQGTTTTPVDDPYARH